MTRATVDCGQVDRWCRRGGGTGAGGGLFRVVDRAGLAEIRGYCFRLDGQEINLRDQ